MATRIYSAPLVSWASPDLPPLAGGPDTPWIRVVGPLPGAFPLALGIGLPGPSLFQEEHDMGQCTF